MLQLPTDQQQSSEQKWCAHKTVVFFVRLAKLIIKPLKLYLPSVSLLNQCKGQNHILCRLMVNHDHFYYHILDIIMSIISYLNKDLPVTGQSQPLISNATTSLNYFHIVNRNHSLNINTCQHFKNE